MQLQWLVLGGEWSLVLVAQAVYIIIHILQYLGACIWVTMSSVCLAGPATLVEVLDPGIEYLLEPVVASFLSVAHILVFVLQRHPILI